jgi:hypothetical protein
VAIGRPLSHVSETNLTISHAAGTAPPAPHCVDFGIRNRQNWTDETHRDDRAKSNDRGVPPVASAV